MENFETGTILGEDHSFDVFIVSKLLVKSWSRQIVGE